MSNAKRVLKGQKINLEGLRQQGAATVKQARHHAEPLRRAGLTPAKVDELETNVEELSSSRSAQLEARRQSKGKTRSEAEIRQQVKRLRRRLANALPSVLASFEDGKATVAREDFEPGEALGDSTPRLLKYLIKIAGPLAVIDAHLLPYFDGKSPSAERASLEAELSSTDAEQEVAVASLPVETVAFYETKGRALELIEEINRLAKNAFDGEAHLIGLFNKDLILRATRANAVAEPEAPMEPTG